eukprot:TRINITY_DN264_c0_g1_i4.p1 TRINITY_DN264_c0_g1~~TRINITY_DN264_c0_g1_i4.p1  ORF type:complete len:655 (-),score=79.51 TRINITY_DN264_c0_g1_i4:443-2407(-)
MANCAAAKATAFDSRDLSNIAWACATLAFLDKPLIEGLAASACDGISHFAPQGLANMARAFAKLEFRDEPFLSASAAMVIRTIHEFEEQGLVNTVWAFAKVAYCDYPLMGAIASAAILKINRFSPRWLGNTAWTFATVAVRNDPLLIAIASASLRQIETFNSQDLTNLAWSFAALNVNDEELLNAIAEASIKKITGFTSQGLANMSWAIATLLFSHKSLSAAISSRAVLRASEFKAQELANVGWAFAKSVVKDEPLMKEISRAARNSLSQFKTLDLANIAWAFSAVGFGDDPLVDSISSAALSKLVDSRNSTCFPREFSEASVFSLVEALASVGKLEDEFLEAAASELDQQGEFFDNKAAGEAPSEPPSKDLICLDSRDLSQGDAPREPGVLAFQKDLYVLWKPPRWSASKASDEDELAARREPGLVLRSWLQEHFGRCPIARDEGWTYGLVHRLDRQTSGAILWAPSYRGLFAARLQFVAGRVLKEYICLCQGTVSWKTGLPRLLQAPLLEVGGGKLGPTRSEVSELGRRAVTEVLEMIGLHDEDGQSYSLLKVRLHTGRTHQIRVHLSNEGHPLVGDPVYGGASPSWCPRQWLHASRLSIDVGAGPLSVEVPVPADLRAALERLRAIGDMDRVRLADWGLSTSDPTPRKLGY